MFNLYNVSSTVILMGTLIYIAKQTNIQKKDLENFTIFVPSLLIQRKNLALFEMLDEKICILNEELERLEMQKKYLLRNMFI